MTPAERILWEVLRRKTLAGVKFRRQHPVGRYILDFYCPQFKLAIEVDGDSHIGNELHDSIRTEALGAYGLNVLRFRNEEILSDLESVLLRIFSAINQLTPRR
jgi:very-short-patch-repair endonuclease